MMEKTRGMKKNQHRVTALLIIIAFMLTMLMPGTFGIFGTAADNTAFISSVEITQVMGKGVNIDTGQYYFMNMFVAEKPTAIQVIMSKVTAIENASLEIYYENNLLTTITEGAMSERQLITFVPDKKDVNSWKSGRYKFTAKINGETSTTEAIFNESRKFSVLIISASVRYNNQTYTAPHIDAGTIPLRSQALPVSENKLTAKFRNAKVSFGTDITGTSGYDIATPEGQMSFLADIEKYRLKSASNYDVVVAVVDSPLGEAAGYTNSEHAVVITLRNTTAGSEEIGSTLLHEIGHILGSGDEYIGGSFSLKINGAPYGVTGKENGVSVTGNRSHFTHAQDNNYSGILIHEVQNPYNPKAKTPMLERSSFMGSSYKHWITSMVWEEAYKRLVPNYQNVLPRVYTDGSIVAARPNINDLTNREIEELKREYRKMLNEVRAAAGYAPYSEDEILISGEKHLQTVAEDALRQRNIGNLIDLNPMLNSTRGDTKYWFGTVQLEAALYEFEENEIEDKRSFFTDSPCGQYFIGCDYMLLAFVRVENVVYYIRTTISNVSPVTNEDEEYKAQPETPPVPDINPVTGDIIDPDDFAEGLYEPYTEAASDTNQSGENNTNNTNEIPYNELTKEERISLIGNDYFDYGLKKFRRDEPDEDTTDEQKKSFDYLLGFYAWYLGYAYDINITAEEAESAIDQETKKLMEEMGTMEVLVAECLFRYYEVIPPQEVREVHWYYQDYGLQKTYGDNPKRSKYDTDTINYTRTPYANLTKEERISLIGNDYFDYGLKKTQKYYPQEHETDYEKGAFDYLLGFYAWYLDYAYDINITAEEAESAIDQETEKLMEETSGWDVLVAECIFRYYELMPPQEIREVNWYYQYELAVYGDNPKRSKYDTDTISYHYPDNGDSDDEDINDPDGEW